MSFCKLITFKNGLPDESVQFHNAWGGSPRIWTALFNAYVPKQEEFDSWLLKPNDRRLWDLASRQDLPIAERAVHAFTFDLFYVSKENFSRFATHLQMFVDKFPCPGMIDHLPAWAQWLKENTTADAVGLYGTTVDNNLWYRHKKCPCCENYIDDEEPVPLSEGTEVYAWLENETGK